MCTPKRYLSILLCHLLTSTHMNLCQYTKHPLFKAKLSVDRSVLLPIHHSLPSPPLHFPFDHKYCFSSIPTPFLPLRISDKLFLLRWKESFQVSVLENGSIKHGENFFMNSQKLYLVTICLEERKEKKSHMIIIFFMPFLKGPVSSSQKRMKEIYALKRHLWFANFFFCFKFKPCPFRTAFCRHLFS